MLEGSRPREYHHKQELAPDIKTNREHVVGAWEIIGREKTGWRTCENEENTDCVPV